MQEILKDNENALDKISMMMPEPNYEFEQSMQLPFDTVFHL